MAQLGNTIVNGALRVLGDEMLSGRLITTKAINDIVEGTGTTAQDKGSGVSPRYFPAKWTFNTGQTVTNGDIIVVKIPCAGHDYGVFISIDNGTTYKPVAVGMTGTSRLTTHFGSGAYVAFIYDSSGTVNSVYPAAGGDSKVNVSGGCWRVFNYYDSGNTYDRNRYNASIKAWGTALKAGNIIVGSEGVYHHLKEGTAFDIRYPILYLNEDRSANATSTNTYDIIHFTVTTTQSITLTAYNPVYIKGTLSGTTFTPVSTTPLTQTVPSTEDGYYYMYLGNATGTTTIYLQERHPIYFYKNGGFREYVGNAGYSNVSDRLRLSRVTEDANTLPGTNESIIKEYDSTSTNLPSAHWYHILTSKGSDNKYATQLALGMTTNSIYYRRYDNSTWSSWQSVGRFTATPTTGQVVITDGTTGGIKSSGYTIAKSVPSDAVFTDTYDQNKFSGTIKAGTSKLVAGNIIVGKDGVYNHLKTGGAFDITYPILYLGSAVAANATTTDTYDIRHFTVTTTQSISLTAYLPVYIKGTLSGTTFTLVSSKPLTQTVPIAFDGYSYMLLGVATSTTTVYLQERHPIYKYYSGIFREYPHDEGNSTTVSGNYAHAEGNSTLAAGVNAHAEGSNTTANAENSHAEGEETKATYKCSHAEGYQTSASADYSHAEGYATKTIRPGSYSHAEGFASTAKGSGSHAEGRETIVTDIASYAHAEGYKTTVSTSYSHAEGEKTQAIGSTAHAEGLETTASGAYSHAEGEKTQATNRGTRSEGYATTASNMYSHSSGHWNAAMITGGNRENTTGTAFVIGNGTASTSLSNAFSVQFNGTVKAASTITASTTADYAEYFEWVDENPNDEDRVGYFVAFSGDNKIRIANNNDEYILGVSSGEPFVLGNGDCDVWNGMVLRDEFRRAIYEPAPKLDDQENPMYDDQGNPIYEGTRPKINPNYDPNRPYINRADRPEWQAVGMLGVLAIRDNGLCSINSYCSVAEDGTARPYAKGDTNKYRVIHRNSPNVVEIVFR